MDISTKYLGLNLKNPVIAGASNIVSDLDNIKRLEDAGVAAIVYKSLFEEQIQLENLEMDETKGEYDDRNAEMLNLFYDAKDAGPKQHLYKLRKAKESISIPLIASLNAVYDESWVDYAKQIQETGVDALELNFYSTPTDVELEGSAVIENQQKLLKQVINAVSIPVSVKLSPYYANPLNIVKKLDEAGAKGFVLFNTLFQPDIDVDKEEQTYPYNLSNEGGNRLPLRFAGLLYENIKGDICSSTGIYTGKDVVKMILAGAHVVQVVSTIYKNKIEYVSKMVEDIENWMSGKGYEALKDFRGKLSKKNSKDYYAYRRAQYVDILMKTADHFKKYPMV